ncbi:MAG: hypothetical protein QOF77_1074 [Solirubrobacteraceae bacterium]|jgi:hypothetical protein|nr:hypothetical protein [Solirubrobacteraceae bacterium]
MTHAYVPPAFFTAAPLVLAGLILLVLHFVMARSTANRCVAAFLAGAIPCPMMLLVHPMAALAMGAVGLAFAVPAYILAEDHDDEGRGGGGGEKPHPAGPGPDPDAGPDLWSEFERDFWSHVERGRELVNA